MNASPGNPGFCVCCRSETFFRIDGTYLRSHYRCSRCESVPRFRHIVHILDRIAPDWTLRKKIHESSPGLSFVQQQASDYGFSHFLPDQMLGSVVNGIRSEDLESLTFGNATFDLFITQDVLEHVFDPARALSEIMRVVRPGGAHVFTAPKHEKLLVSRPRARKAGEGIEHLMPAEYHGNPVGDHRSLVTWDYGADFETLISVWTGCPVTTYVTRDPALGLDGQYPEVFVVRKP